MTHPLDLPLYGKVKLIDIAKENFVALWNSVIKPDSVQLKEEPNDIHTIGNDFVFVFTCRELPIELLKRAGVLLRTEEYNQQTV
jgi:hypothetical protein